jgi:RimJ/RimL family protein N-acetyltransferase
MASYPALETARLILRPVEMADAPAIQRIFAQWEVVKHLNAGVPWPYPEDGAEAFFRDVTFPAIARGECWAWSIFPKAEPDRLIGRIDLGINEEANRGFWLDPAWQRQGLMTEAADITTDYWFETLGQPVLRIFKAVDNEASRRISLTQGMRCIATVEKDYVCGRLPSEVWEITADEWRARRGQR